MWQALAGFVSALLGFGSGASGLQPVVSNTGGTGGSATANIITGNLCYSPEIDTTVTLTWPDNFQNLADHRPTLNSSLFGSYPPIFNTDTNCLTMLFHNVDRDTKHATRTYIRVRQNVRISSCKTDELVGPYNSSGKSCPGQWKAKPIDRRELANRGSCTLKEYTDLRKIAEISQNGQTEEVFWNPMTSNVGCNYSQSDPNCGPGDRENANLKDFIYVLKKRDAFTPDAPAVNCRVRWDAGTSDRGACSHYFDVYMAEDLYKKSQLEIPNSDPDYKAWSFVKQQLENCHEEALFTPLGTIDETIFPPLFLSTPFLDIRDIVNPSSKGKIIPQTQSERFTYEQMIKDETVDPVKTSLVKISQFNGPLIMCPETPSPDSPSPSLSITPSQPLVTPTEAPETPASCYISLGVFPAKKQSGEGVQMRVYRNAAAPESFYLTQDNDVYQYSLTEESLPTNTNYSPSLQLTALKFSTENKWTWATPWCKPAVYLYPEKPIQVSVSLSLSGTLTQSIPPYYPPAGWQVMAHPDGTVFPLSAAIGPTPYPYLYYEADIHGITIPKEGWVVQRSDIRRQTADVLKALGFSEKEIADFHAYWLPRLTQKPYYFVSLIPQEEIDRTETLTIIPRPDTMLRTRVVFEGLDGPRSVSPPTLPGKKTRKGFTVADWGGTLVGASCTSVTIQ